MQETSPPMSRPSIAELALSRVRSAPPDHPFVVAQLGQSLDGRIATISGDSRGISGPAALDHLHALRAAVDAVIVGVGTVIADDPRLTVRRVDGPIDGILHGAGIERSARYERKGRDNVLATLGAKIEGAYHLMTLTRQDPVRHFIGFGSIGGRLGSNGQTDYCLASDMLCKLISWYRTERPDCRAVGFHWHPWDEIGMAAFAQLDLAVVQPLHHLVVADQPLLADTLGLAILARLVDEFTLRRRARHDATRAVHGGVERLFGSL